jgi:carbon storage regulator CsrA
VVNVFFDTLTGTYRRAAAMLVLTRKLNRTGESPGEDIIYIGEDIRVQIVRDHAGVVGLGISAPKDVLILRAEIADEELRDRWGDNGQRAERRAR